MTNKIQTQKLYSNGYLLWDKEIRPWNDIHDRVNVFNLRTQEWNDVAVYENTKGRHVKINRSSKSTHYLEEFTQEVTLVPLQVFEGFIDG